MENRSDIRQLVAEIVDGDTNLFQIIIEQHQKLVAHIVFKMINNAADREDLCQEVFVKVYKSLGTFQFESKLSTWVAKIAYNTCINYLGKKKLPLYDDKYFDDASSIENCVISSQNTDAQVIMKELSTMLHHQIYQLPVKYRTILTLFHLEEMTYAEIAEITELPEGTVKSHLFRARKLLKDRLLLKYNPEELCL